MKILKCCEYWVINQSINLKLIDFLPTYLGSTGVFPVDLLEISGADFDIDKLYPIYLHLATT